MHEINHIKIKIKKTYSTKHKSIIKTVWKQEFNLEREKILKGVSSN